MPSILPENQVFPDDDGEPIVNGSIYIGVKDQDPVANSITIYSDRELTTTLANPQATDSFGRSVNKIWVPGKYSIQVNDEDAVQRYQDLDAGGQVNFDDAHQSVDTMADLLSADTEIPSLELLGFHSAGDGGGTFYWDAAEDKANHNGITIVDPDNTADLALWDATEQATWFTAGTGAGCWVRRLDGKPISFEMGGAKRDDVTDDIIPMQEVVDLGFLNLIPISPVNGTYRISKPLLVYGNSVALSPVTGTKIVGESRESTIIKKYGSANAGTGFTYDSNSVIIVANADAQAGTESTGSAKWVHLENLFLIGNSDDVVNGIHIARNNSNSTYRNLRIQSYTGSGMYQTADNWQSTWDFIHIWAFNGVTSGDFGFNSTSGISTSNIYSRCYVIGTQDTAYNLSGTYQSMISTAADGCSGTVYDMSSYRGTMVSPGSESTGAEIQMKIGQFANVTITEPDLIGNFTSATATQFDVAAGGQCQIYGGRVGYDGTEMSQVAPGYLYKIAAFGIFSKYDVAEGLFTLDGILSGSEFSSTDAVLRNGVNQRTGSVTIAANATTTVTVTISDSASQGPVSIDFSGFTTAAAGSVMVKTTAGGFLAAASAVNVSKIIDSSVNGSLTLGAITKTVNGFSFPVINANLTATGPLVWVATGVYTNITVVAT